MVDMEKERKDVLMSIIQRTFEEKLPISYIKSLWKLAVEKKILRTVQGSLLDFRNDLVLQALEDAEHYEDFKDILSVAIKPPEVQGFFIKAQDGIRTYYKTTAVQEYPSKNLKFFLVIEDQKVFAYEPFRKYPKLGKYVSEDMKVNTGDIFGISKSVFVIIEYQDAKIIRLRFKGILRGNELDKQIDVNKPEFKIGRGYPEIIELDDANISRKCCRFKRHESAFVLSPVKKVKKVKKVKIIKFFHNMNTLDISDSPLAEITSQSFVFSEDKFECELKYKTS